MKQRSLVSVGVLAAFVLLLWPQRGQAFVEIPYSLGKLIADSTNIMVLQVDKVDKENNRIIYRKLEDLKGKHPTDIIRHNIGKAQLVSDREWKYTMAWAEVGKKAIFFHNGGASETCIGMYWYQTYAGGEWWNQSHGEALLLRSFAGNPEKLASAVKAIMAGQEVIVPCMEDGDKNKVLQGTARIQRLKASMKIQDYNQKRDFVGWGGEDFRRMAVGLHGPPFAAQDSVAVDQEGAAFDAAHLLPVHLFHLHDAEQVAGQFVRVGDQFEGQAQLGLEPLVRLEAIPGDPEHRRPGGHQFAVQVAELARLRRAAGSVVLRVEVDHHRLAAQGATLAVCTNKLHTSTVHCNSKWPRIRGVCDVPTNHFALLYREAVFGLSVQKHDISESPHKGAVGSIFT